MTQTLQLFDGGEESMVEIPGPHTYVIEGVPWGRVEHLFTPAFWFLRVVYAQLQGKHRRPQIGATLLEEVVACLLGGYGMPAELGLHAFARLRDRGLLMPGSKQSDLLSALCEPFRIGTRLRHYRFPKQKARFIHNVLRKFEYEEVPTRNERALRSWLLSFDGVGLKTASWIIRNHLLSDQVAILDIHIFKAGLLAGVFSASDKIERDYLNLEDRLVRFAKGLGVPLHFLDAVIWDEMRGLSTLANRSIMHRNSHTALSRSSRSREFQ